MTRRAVVTLVVAGLVAAVGCTSGADPPTGVIPGPDASVDLGGADAGASGDALADADGSTSDVTLTCAIPNLAGAPAFTVTAMTAAFPGWMATGGTVASGIYLATTVDVYEGGTTPTAAREVLVLDATAGVLSEADDGASDGGLHSTLGTFSASGSTFAITLACGSSGSASLGYTASGGTLLLFDPLHRRIETLVEQSIPQG